MRRSILLGLVSGLMVLGSAMVSSAQEAPVLEKVWAPAEINYGGLAKIYIKASDPQGDMRWLVVTAAGEHGGPSGSVPIRLKKGLGKDLNGYVYWNTKQANRQEGSAKVEILVEDWKGNESETKSVTIKMVRKGAKAQKPPADFQEKEIGPIMLNPFHIDTP